MPNITIGNTVIPFPDSGSPQDWAPAVIAFAKAVQNQFLLVGSPYDKPPIVQQLSSNANASLKIINSNFSPLQVRSFIMDYAIYRVTNTNFITEAGKLTGVYNSTTASWEIQDEFIGDKQSDGTSWHSFAMGSGDYVYLTTVILPGTYNGTVSTFSYSAKTELVANI